MWFWKYKLLFVLLMRSLYSDDAALVVFLNYWGISDGSQCVRGLFCRSTSLIPVRRRVGRGSALTLITPSYCWHRPVRCKRDATGPRWTGRAKEAYKPAQIKREWKCLAAWLTNGQLLADPSAGPAGKSQRGHCDYTMITACPHYSTDYI